MDGYVSLDVAAQLAKYKAGFAGGPWNKTPYTPPPMTIVEGVPDDVRQAQSGKSTVESMPIGDPWINRRSK